jgi:ADP-ribose pyrophosphatase YjhB (NUDIX family)
LIERGLFIKKQDGFFTYRVAALIIKDNKLLMAKNIDHPCYYTVGGGVEMNETSEEAVIREILEETGIKMEIDKLAFIQERFLKINEQKFHEIVFFYTIKNTNAINISENSFTDQGSKETLHWLPLNELKNINVVPEILKNKSLTNFTRLEHIISKEW